MTSLTSEFDANSRCFFYLVMWLMFGFISKKQTACNTFSLKIGEFGKKN